MRQRDLVEAYIAIKDLNEQTLKSGKTAKKVFELTNKLQEYWDFQVQEEEKIFHDHPKYESDINGIRIPDDATDEDKQKIFAEVEEIQRRIRELNNLDCDFEFTPFTISLDDEEISISGKNIGRLQSFVKFE